MSRTKDLTGQKFGKLTVIKQLDERSKDNRIIWECLCDCGNTHKATTDSLTSGHTKSCGCLKSEAISKSSQNRFKDLIGQKFGRLTVVRKTDGRNNKNIIWECLCDCGNVCYISSQCLQNGDTKSCGCLKKEQCSRIGKTKKIDLTGQKFGRLTVIKESDRIKNRVVWLCRCDCGNEKNVVAEHLTSGKVKSCGCLLKECGAEVSRKYLKSVWSENSKFRTNIAYIKSNTLPKNNKTGIKGVFYDKVRDKYIASIGFKCKQYYLGIFNDIEDAINTRKEAEKNLHGKFLEWYMDREVDNGKR